MSKDKVLVDEVLRSLETLNTAIDKAESAGIVVEIEFVSCLSFDDDLRPGTLMLHKAYRKINLVGEDAGYSEDSGSVVTTAMENEE